MKGVIRLCPQHHQRHSRWNTGKRGVEWKRELSKLKKGVPRTRDSEGNGVPPGVSRRNQFRRYLLLSTLKLASDCPYYHGDIFNHIMMEPRASNMPCKPYTTEPTSQTQSPSPKIFQEGTRVGIQVTGKANSSLAVEQDLALEETRQQPAGSKQKAGL